MNSASTSAPGMRGPHPGILAILYMTLFCAGLYPVTALYRQPYWPLPMASAATVTSFFQTQGPRVLVCIFLQLGAMICLGLFTATMVSRLRALGANAPGPYIALFGGFLVVGNAMVGTMAVWTMIRPAVSSHGDLVVALNYFAYGLGGPGFSMPMGLLIAGISVTGGFLHALPRWLVACGLVLAAAGELSWLHLLLFPKLLFLIPLVRFPGFLWLIAAGFLLARSRKAVAASVA